MKTLLSFLSVLFLSVPSFLLAQNGLHFDGSNDYVQTTYGGVTGNNDRTFEAWVKISSSATGNNCILDYGTNVASSRNTFLINDNNQLAYIAGGTNTNISSTANAITRDVWTHVAMVMQSGQGTMYVNGVAMGTGSLTGVNTPAGNTALRIGQRVPGGSIPFLGEIDEVRVWSVARTAAEIQATMNAEFCTVPATLEAYYQFNEGVAAGSNTGVSVLPDNAAGANNGTLTNFALTGTTSNWLTGASLTAHNNNAGIFQTSGCTPFISLGNQVLTSSGVYDDTVITATGCDSIYILAFTAIDATSSSFTASACDMYTAPSGAQYSSSAIISDTIMNAAGCDSVMTIDLTVNNSAQGSLMASACDSYTSPSGKVFTSTGVYQDTIPSMVVCDSIISIDLTIYTASTSSITVSECLSYTSPSGVMYTMSGLYNDTIANSAGCDSIITIDLTIMNPTLVGQNQSACDSYTSPSGKVWTSSGVYQDTVLGGVSCATIYTIDLEINNSVATTIMETSCGAYISNQGNTYTSTGSYTEMAQTTAGCDSTITIELTVLDVDTTISQSGLVLTANEAGANYQWYNCEGDVMIAGETEQTFTPSANGSYYAEVQTASCAFNTACYEVVNVGIERVFNSEFSLYPNPSLGTVNIDLAKHYKNIEVRVLSIEGKQLQALTYSNVSKLQLELEEAKGLYTIIVYTDNEMNIFKVLKLK